MMDNQVKGPLLLGALIGTGLVVLGYLLGSSAIRFKEFERVVSVKGLSEREVPADIAVWPIRFTGASNQLAPLYAQLDADTQKVLRFLTEQGFEKNEITVNAPAVVDKLAQEYGGNGNVQLRFTGSQTITVYSSKVEQVRSAQNAVVELGRQGVALGGADYRQPTEFLFTRLNDIKPQMIEEATRNAREVAKKFAADSNSKLGKIRSANQGQFSVSDRDSNTPHIKNVRVVSTIDYYLSD
jgi:hypothetical protein